MIVTAIVFAVVVLPIMWVVFAPVNIRVNSAINLYELRQAGTIRVSLHPGEVPFVRIRVFGFSVNTGAKPNARKKAVEKKPAGTKRKKRQKSFRAIIEFVRRIVRSFQCKRFVCHVDFDDVVFNAQVFPVGHFISRGPVVFNVNFERRYLLDIWVRARVHHMLWAFIRFYTTK